MSEMTCKKKIIPLKFTYAAVENPEKTDLNAICIIRICTVTLGAHLMLFLFLHFTKTNKLALPLSLEQYSMVNVIGYLFPLLSPSFSLPGVVK